MIFKKIFLKSLILIAISCLFACTNYSSLQHANQIAQRGGLVQQSVNAGLFVLNTYSRIHDRSKPIHVYIEGDGLAWIRKNQISIDPTPKDALSLQLASLDNADNVVYIARPCQFHDFSASDCNNVYWTNKRFAEEVVASVNLAVEYYAKQVDRPVIQLIGYSGGAAIAVLIAARRDDVASLRTVAGNLDHVRLNKYHRVSAMPESLNPIDEAPKLTKIPQLHFVGLHDMVVPKQIAEGFLAHQLNSNCARILEVPNASHETGWIEVWPRLLNQELECWPS